MNDRELTIVACVAGAALQIVLALLVEGSTWPIAAQVLVVLVPVGLLITFFYGRRRLRAQSKAKAAEQKKRSNQPQGELADRIQRGWFVTFSSDPDPHNAGGTPQYATAIAEVDAVEGDDVILIWRDKGNFPTRVPVKLLEASHVYRRKVVADGTEHLLRTRNDGLYFPGSGGRVVGNGWRAHRHAPLGPLVRRWRDLDSDHRAANGDGQRARVLRPRRPRALARRGHDERRVRGLAAHQISPAQSPPRVSRSSDAAPAPVDRSAVIASETTPSPTTTAGSRVRLLVDGRTCHSLPRVARS